MHVSLEDISQKISPLHLQDIANIEHSSYYFDASSYSLLIIRLFYLSDDGLSGFSSPYLLLDNSLYFYLRESKEFVVYPQAYEKLSELIQDQLKRSEQLVMHYIKELDALEDQLYDRKFSPIFLDIWFDLKKDITRMERMFERAFESLKEFHTLHSSKNAYPHNSFINVMEHLKRYQRLTSLNSSKLDTLYNYYTSLKNDKMNANIYTLTILSGIFLPLNLIVGFFGMNTENLFFKEDPSGTLYVVYILSVVFLLFVALFPLITFLERFVLRKLLGRFNLYNKLVKSVKNISLFTQKR